MSRNDTTSSRGISRSASRLDESLPFALSQPSPHHITQPHLQYNESSQLFFHIAQDTLA
ncbi:hypothetical protein T440DRAFT_468371 [Plenodomus tracheiphilus IPT5]|uniref:Uncharacterized protein n=1 Tax=Plenodomus tracheiphilus IPT5 TaxID=1408161 RepID=A0A6A7B5X1_9PLEO|nr:hypothetical protein T440DRAFT_468371 [Plenodomus tracheiphilus IPT5]